MGRVLPGVARAVVMVALPAAGACLGDPTGPVQCTTEARAGIVVEVVEITDGTPLAEGATLTLRDGDYVETSDQTLDGRYLLGAFERPGVYDVRVDREGWVPWRTIAVEVEADFCHVIPVQLRAVMAPAPEPRTPGAHAG